MTFAMRKKILYGLLSVFPLLTVASCASLDLEPVNIVNEEDSFGNESAILAHFATLYGGILMEDFDFSSEGINNARLEYYTGYGVARYNDDVMDESGKSQYINGAMGSEWLNYTMIRTVNEFMVNLDKYASNFTPEQVARWKSEARVIRAWYYWSIAKRYGGMPIITEPQPVDVDNPESMMVPRASEKEMWDFIISEIDQAIEDGLAETAESLGRIDIYTALALKARAAIYAASIARYNSPIEGIGNYVDPDTGKQVCGIPASDAEYYYKIAFDAAKEIIKSGKYSLARGLSSDGADNFALLFQDPTKHNEDIFVKQFQYPALTHWWDYYHLPAPWGQSWYDNPTLDLVLMYEKLDGSEDELAGIGEWGPEIPSPDYYFTGRDYRFAGTCYYPGGPFPGGDGTFDIRRGLIEESGSVYDGTGQATIGGNQYNIRGTYGMGEWFETQTGFLCRKYILESNIANVSASQPSDQTWIAIRYAEILLIAAEAAAELGTDEENIGLDSINDIRTRAGLKETGTLTVDEVRKQWVCEMVFENQIFWCMRRWRTLDTKLTDNFKCKGVQPFWDPVRDIWKIKVVDACRYPKTSFQNRYYYGWINTSFIATNPQIKQNYGY